MTSKTKNQWIILGGFVLLFAALGFSSYVMLPIEQLLPEGMQAPAPEQPRWVLGLANAGIILVVYGLAGAAGYWFARRFELPGIYRLEAGWRNWLGVPMLIGIVLGILIVAADQVFAAMVDWRGFPHPQFPFSIIASATSGIGEEILFRSFVLGFWAFLASLLLRRWRANRAALWIGNVVAAFASSASHLPAAMLLLGVASPSAIPIPILLELFVLNGLLGIVAGERYLRDGLVAAIGIHFWADIVWHVIWPLTSGF